MPIPVPTADETDQDFLERCMGDTVMVDEFPEDQQRMAVCSIQSQYADASDVDALDVSLDREAEDHAASLIKAGKTTEGRSWSGPSADDENRYLEANGVEAYANWFLGRESDAGPDTKAHYSFPFSDDFKTVNRRGLNAIRSRAAQFDDKSVFDAAGRLIELWPDEEMSDQVQRITFQRKALRTRGRYLVDQDKGLMQDVSLIQMGEAKGHGMWIDQGSLESALAVLEGNTLPAYVTHAGAIESDRLLNEIGVFSGFYVEAGKLKAETFKVLDSFMSDEAERYRRLFDLAEAMPDAFGLSMVFEAALVWVQDDGLEVPIEEGSPENSLRDLPSVRFISIRSADFVDTPAANEGGLFSQPRKLNQDQAMSDDEEKEVTTQEVDQATEESADNAAADAAAVATEATEAPDAEEADTAEESDDTAEESDDTEESGDLDELRAKIDEQAATIAELTAKLEEAAAKTDKLSALISGAEALEQGDEDTTPGKSILEQFSQATGADKTRLWKQNKQEILRSARG
jgi:hypothetical protein